MNKLNIFTSKVYHFENLFSLLIACFTLSPNISNSRRLFYKICVITNWGSIGILILPSIFDATILENRLNSYLSAYTFWFEMIAVWAFGIAWLVKGKFDKDVMSILKKEDSNVNLFFYQAQNNNWSTITLYLRI